MSLLRTRLRPRTTVAVLGVSLSLSVACGHGSATGGDARLVKASLVRLHDLPPDQKWKVDNEEDDPDDKAFARAIDSCERRYDPTHEAAVAEQDADTFTNDDGVSISSTGQVVRDRTKRAKFFDSLDDQFACFGRALASFLEKQPMEGIAVAVNPPYPLDVRTDADRSAERTIELQVRTAGRHAMRMTVYLDAVAVEQGELLAGYLFIHTGSLSIEEETDVIGKALARVRDQQDG